MEVLVTSNRMPDEGQWPFLRSQMRDRARWKTPQWSVHKRHSRADADKRSCVSSPSAPPAPPQAPAALRTDPRAVTTHGPQGQKCLRLTRDDCVFPGQGLSRGPAGKMRDTGGPMPDRPLRCCPRGRRRLSACAVQVQKRRLQEEK